jgi:hypothetical protein
MVDRSKSVIGHEFSAKNKGQGTIKNHKSKITKFTHWMDTKDNGMSRKRRNDTIEEEFA